jgi:hypothetical protein
LVLGCKQEADDDLGYELDSRLIGTWKSTGEWGYDQYIITSTRISYGGDYGSGYSVSTSGTIRAVTTFNIAKDAGVIIIEYDASHGADAGKFIGIYYKSFTPNVSVQMGTASLYPNPAEELTLDAAKKAFTLDKEGDYMSYYGTYSKQP